MENTVRKAFNFYKSYFDVYSELKSNKDKVDFIDALLNKQFYDIEPSLSGIVHFAYLSQKHSIDRQVDGFKTKTNSKLHHPSEGGGKGGGKAPSGQEKEKGKEKGKEKEEYTYNKFYDEQIFDENQNYKVGLHPMYVQFVDYLFAKGDDNMHEPLKGVLNMREQLTNKMFENVFKKTQAQNIKLLDMCSNIENGGYYKKNTNFYSTLNTWISRR